MVYESFQLGPTEGQMDDLSQGTEVMLSKNHLDGEVTFHLTKAQMKRVLAAKASGRGCRLKLSASQLKHIEQKGSGVFTDFLKANLHRLAPIVRSGIKAGVQAGAAYAGAKLGKTVGNVVKKGLDGIGRFTDGKISKATGAQSGYGMQQQKQILRMQGRGWFGDILKKLAHGGVDVVAGLLGGGLYGPGQGPTANDIKQLRAIEGMHGRGFWGKLLKGVAHGGVDAIAGIFGGAVNPLANANEGLWAATHQKKVAVGQGLSYP